MACPRAKTRFQKASKCVHVLLRNREKGTFKREWLGNTNRKVAGGKKPKVF